METNTETGMSDKLQKLIASSIAVVAIIVIVVALISGQNKNKTTDSPQEPKFVADDKNRTSLLYFSPSTQKAKSGAMISAKVYVNTGESVVNGFDIKTIYDPSIFEVLKVVKEPVLAGLSQEIKNEVNNKTGAHNYTAFGLDKKLFINGPNVFLYTLEIKVKETAPAGTYTISFAPNTVVSASGAKQDVLKNGSPLVVNVTK